ncbi:Divalent-cation tolerance protein CutA [Rickettsiales endosymbiont of Paramecium tredecaurelia]|uniref:divalent-cation tolerance protein CutA n=1 Tax=Candidatus Sarmatiella mevalonica TaxID=2770581 RepID=UPI001922C1C4|nr:divalent-cation tolerance protein CutA [Candidatus Sarmatiella mevalonica]MBL3285035.1 Divalent-cation tolerance protein CutA [Candidatus Sarmatiella mevalonica]
MEKRIGYCLIITTTNDIRVAENMARKLLSEHLAACVEIQAIDSHFLWHNQIEYLKEYKLTIKSKSDKYKLVEYLLRAMHNYDIPEVIKLDIEDGTKEYFDWIEQTMITSAN